ncbi:MAG TPA: transglutaminase domain-containing protein, partial [Ferruginibacter sp.]|nr:transglutaminase domain-containing protein [Ferruginibacter sp.]
TADLDAMLRPVTDPYQRMRIVHKYVRDNMQWNELDNIWALNGVKAAWKDKKGTSGEINLILINLLKDAGLNAHAILVSTSDNGAVNTGVAEVKQFNKVLAYVEIEDKVYVLDAIEKYTPDYLIPSEVMASEGLLIANPESMQWGWKTLWDGSHSNKRTVQFDAEVDDKGMMKGNAIVTDADYARVEMMSELKQSTDKTKKELQTQQDLQIDTINIENADTDSLPLVRSFKFSVPTASSGDYHYFSVNWFAGLNKNPFIADERQTDVFFATMKDYSIDCSVVLPDGYVMDDLPKNTKLIMPDTSIVFTRKTVFENGILSVVMNLQLRSAVFAAADYETFKEFYKKMFAMLNDKFVYKKKA